MRKHLYLQIYFSLVATLAVFAVVASMLWWAGPRDREAARFLRGVSNLVGSALPAAEEPDDVHKAALQRLADDFGADLTLLDRNGSVVVSIGAPLGVRRLPPSGSNLVRSPGHGMVAVLALPDGRHLLADEAHGRRHRPFHALFLLALLAGALALVSLPLARRLTRRLERLKDGVDNLGRGDLGARVGVEGRDEVAGLAQSFNRAAERIERLVRTQKDALATASHELRSPLARLRVAVELLGNNARPDVVERMTRDIEELDELIGEILLSSRLDADAALVATEDVDLVDLLAEEGARGGADVGGQSVVVRGDSRLLRRMVRNLFENARRYGGGSGIEAEVAATADGAACLCVHDRGAGIPAEERERVFEAFYRRAGTSEGEGGGVGLGLALVRRIAERHGGSARALERQGGGATLEVRLART